MTDSGNGVTRSIEVAADDFPLPVVFEMGGAVVTLAPHDFLRLEISGPPSAQLRIGCGANGVSIYRDQDLIVHVFDSNGSMLNISGFG